MLVAERNSDRVPIGCPLPGAGTEESMSIHSLYKGDLEIDHVIPLAARGEDGENNFALTHLTCNRKKGASDLRVARRLMLFERIQEDAIEAGARGANLGHLLAHFGGAKRNLRLKEEGDRVRYTLTAVSIVPPDPSWSGD